MSVMEQTAAPRIVLVHAEAAAIAPTWDAFQRTWPDARCSNLLDDTLRRDLEADERLTAAMRARIGALADHAEATGAEGILFTCATFGPAVEEVAVRLPLPVLKPHEAVLEAALDAGNHIGLLATHSSAVLEMGNGVPTSRSPAWTLLGQYQDRMRARSDGGLAHRERRSARRTTCPGSH